MKKRLLSRKSGSVVMAMVLGTALSTIDPSRTTASVPSPEAIQDITRYCQVCWRNARLPVDRWPDCTQEVFVRLLASIDPQNWSRVMHRDGEERREFLRTIDAVKKRTQRSRNYAPLAEGGNAQPADARIGTQPEDWEEIDRLADRVLSTRQRAILRLTREGWTVPEIAQELNTSVERVSDEKYKAIRKLRHQLVERNPLTS